MYYHYYYHDSLPFNTLSFSYQSFILITPPPLLLSLLYYYYHDSPLLLLNTLLFFYQTITITSTTTTATIPTTGITSINSLPFKTLLTFPSTSIPPAATKSSCAAANSCMAESLVSSNRRLSALESLSFAFWNLEGWRDKWMGEWMDRWMDRGR